MKTGTPWVSALLSPKKQHDGNDGPSRYEVILTGSWRCGFKTSLPQRYGLFLILPRKKSGFFISFPFSSFPRCRVAGRWAQGASTRVGVGHGLLAVEQHLHFGYLLLCGHKKKCLTFLQSKTFFCDRKIRVRRYSLRSACEFSSCTFFWGCQPRDCILLDRRSGRQRRRWRLIRIMRANS